MPVELIRRIYRQRQERRMALSNDSVSARQREVYDFVVSFYREVGLPPTVREVMARFGFASPNAAYGHLVALTRKGLLRVVKGEGRERGHFLPVVPSGCCPCCRRLRDS